MPMKKIIILSMAGMLALSFGCSKGGDNQDIQREEEMNRGDMIDHSYKQRDITPEPGPSNINRPDKGE